MSDDEVVIRRIETVRALLEASARAGAAPETIAATERRLGLTLPGDLRLLVSSFDGSDNATPIENGWITFWPMSAWRRGSEVADAAGGSTSPQGLLFADHSIDSWWYALDPQPDSSWAVYIVDGIGGDKLVATSVADFLQAIIDDSIALYRGR